MTTWVSPFTELSLDDAPRFGGKSANLGELASAGFPVPPGFSIGEDAYLAAMDRAGIRDRLLSHRIPAPGTGVADLIALSEELRRIVLDAPIPDSVARQILDAYTELGENVPVAVRSSAPAEDAADTSFAGIHESYTDVVGPDALLRAVKDCWASLWSERAMTYRGVRGYDDEPSVAVVVQTMVESEMSGVAFTADPRTGATDRIVIEAAFGLGEVVVGGQVEPDTYVVAKSDLGLIDAHIGMKNVEVVAGRTDEGTRRITGARREARVLDDAEVRAVASLAVDVENHYGKPQDLEYAWAEGVLWIVQARPITTLGEGGPAAGTKAAAGSAGADSVAEALVTGLGAGPGKAAGRVRILTDLADGEKLADGEILVASMTNPDWLPVLRRAAAIVTDEGGITCHAAIVGRELGKPVIVGARTATTILAEGELVTVDGDAGAVHAGDTTVTAAPIPETVVTGAAMAEPTATAVYVNLATPEAAERVAATDVDGVGLLRAEFLITEALDGMHPSRLVAEGREREYVDRMAEGIGRIAAAFDPRPVVYRATDLRSNEFRGLLGGEIEADERNPMIGYRGCFRYIREPEMFRLELDALARVRERHGNLHMMIPFVRTRWELEECLAIIDAHPIGRDRGMKRWVMAEVPSVVHWLPEYAELGIDGVSIGSNDLTQLILGVDRDSEHCAELFDAMDPAVLDAIDRIIDAAHENGLTVSLCGQAVSTQAGMAEHLVARGITSVSVTPDVVDRTRRAVARAERKILLDAARRTAVVERG